MKSIVKMTIFCCLALVLTCSDAMAWWELGPYQGPFDICSSGKPYNTKLAKNCDVMRVAGAPRARQLVYRTGQPMGKWLQRIF